MKLFFVVTTIFGHYVTRSLNLVDVAKYIGSNYYVITEQWMPERAA